MALKLVKIIEAVNGYILVIGIVLTVAGLMYFGYRFITRPRVPERSTGEDESTYDTDNFKKASSIYRRIQKDNMS